MTYQIIQGNNIDVLKTFPDNYFDSVVTDPPYGIDFLGKDWDSDTGSLETYSECLRVLKPGGHLLAFSAARTYHHLAITIERAGFEIRDQIMWVYSSGFPKSQDVGRKIHKQTVGKPDKQRFDIDIMIKENDYYRHPDTNKMYRKLPDINGDRLKNSHEGDKYSVIFEEVLQVDNEYSGWGTNLKPAHEPICMARKPCLSSVVSNVQRYGTGAINIDGCRIPIEGTDTRNGGSNGWNRIEFGEREPNKTDGQTYTPSELGRFPSNVIGEIEGYQKYFYCPKVGRQERHSGFDTASIPQIGDTHPDKVKQHPLWDPSIGGDAARLKQKIIDSGNYKGNNHPTVKPVELMKYLVTLVTPKNGTVLDPFNGSGSTGMACVEAGFNYVGIELDNSYVEISKKRIDAHDKKHNINSELFVVE